MPTYYQQIITGTVENDEDPTVLMVNGTGPGGLFTEQDIIDMASDHGDPIEVGDGYARSVFDNFGASNPYEVYYQGIHPIHVPTLAEAVGRMRDAASSGDLRHYEDGLVDGSPAECPEEGRLFVTVGGHADGELSIDVLANNEDGFVTIDLGRVSGLVYTVWLDYVEGEPTVAVEGWDGEQVVLDIVPAFEEDGTPDLYAIEEAMYELGYAGEESADWHTYDGGLVSRAIRFS